MSIDNKKGLLRGRFEENVNREAQRFSASHEVDRRLYSFDIQGSLAHAKMLQSKGILTQGELAKIQKAFSKISKEIEKGEFVYDDALEDIHMHIESRLTELVGPPGQKLHTGRSRNDQVATDFRLYCKDASLSLQNFLRELQIVLLNKAKEHQDVIIPAYTHLQQAQPIRCGHYFLAYLNMFSRDQERLIEQFSRLDILPLGVGALAGTGLKNDRKLIQKELAFSKISDNSLDTVSDRDFALELSFSISLIGLHLSRICEEIIIYFSSEFDMIELDAAFCTGSSLMPQKSNPDMAELIRGKTGRFMGNFVNLYTTVKGLPLTYNRDLQEDKEGVFDSVEQIKDCLSVFTPMLNTLAFKKDIMDRQKDDYMLATDIAEYLVNKKVPFRVAHEITGKIVRFALANDKKLKELHLKDYKNHHSKFEKDIFNLLDFQKSADAKTTHGGTALKEIKRQIKTWERKLKK